MIQKSDIKLKKISAGYQIEIYLTRLERNASHLTGQ